MEIFILLNYNIRLIYTFDLICVIFNRNQLVALKMLSIAVLAYQSEPRGKCQWSANCYLITLNDV